MASILYLQKDFSKGRNLPLKEFKSLQLSLYAIACTLLIVKVVGQSCELFLPGTTYCIQCQENSTLMIIYDNQTAYCGQVYEEYQSCWPDKYYEDLLMNETGMYKDTIDITFAAQPTLTPAQQEIFYYLTSSNLSFCMSFIIQDLGTNCTYALPEISGIEGTTLNIYGFLNIGCSYPGQQLEVVSSVFPGVYFFAGYWIEGGGDQYCIYTTAYDPSVSQCIPCGNLFPNCASCSLTECTVCNYLYFWNPNYFNQTLNQIAGSCLLDGCGIGEGPIYGTGYKLNALEFKYDMVLNNNGCKKCSKGYNFNSSGDCAYIKDKNLTLKFVVQSIQDIDDIEDDIATPQFYHLDTHNYSLPYFSLSQVLGVMNQLYEDGSYYQLNATIYLTQGYHIFFYCNSLAYPNSFCTYQTDPSIYQQPFGTDNIYLHIKPLECAELGELQFIIDSSLCVDLTIDAKPTILLNQQWAYFNISGFTIIENIIFSAQITVQGIIRADSTFIQNSIQQVFLNTSDNENGFYFDMTQEEIAAYDGDDPWLYSYHSIPQSDTDVTSKCRQNQGSEYYYEQESIQQCQGEPNHPSFFDDFSYYYYADSQWHTTNGQDITRTFSLFNVYAFDSYRSTRNALPELRILNCEFQYFLADYTALITIQNNNYRQRTADLVVSFVLNGISNVSTHFYHYYGSDKGAKIFINNSNFSDSNFCKGLISSQKKLNLSNSHIIGDYSQYYAQNNQNSSRDDTAYITIIASYFKNLNAYKNVSALAKMQTGVSQTYSFQSEFAPLEFRLTTHRGMILNLDGFQGQVEITGCNIEKNKFLIPEVVIGKQTLSTVKQINTFYDCSNIEYKMAICSQEYYQNQYFLNDGFDSTADIDSFFDSFERLSTIYISGNQGNMIFTNNNFTNNIGSFGGAITINSPNWQTDASSYIYIANNSFSNNMAYFAGNAIYIRFTSLNTNVSKQCGGAYLYNNTFTHNIGLKKHNGGAVAAYCSQVISILHDDYYRTSEHVFNTSQLNINIYDLGSNITSLVIPNSVFTLQNCLFLENFSGLKGTAVYIRYITQIKILNCRFIGNKAVLQQEEIKYSPYYYFLQYRTLSYYSSNPLCPDELTYMLNCKEATTQIDWPYTKGALYIEHCLSSSCFDTNGDTPNAMQALIYDTLFDSNRACPIMDEFFPTDLATSIYISGGVNNTILNSQFLQQDQTNTFYNIQAQLKAFYPSNYYNLSQSPHIYVSNYPILPKQQADFFNTTIQGCLFQGNRNIQPLGIPNGYLQTGSLIVYITNYNFYANSFTPLISLIDNIFTNNTFRGLQTSLIYVNNGLLNIIGCIFSSNGYLGIFSQTGSVFYLDIGSQQILIQNNSFNYNFAIRGSIIYQNIESYLNEIVIDGGVINQNFNQKEGAITIENNGFGTIILQINNFIFQDCHSQQGGALYLDSIAKLLFSNSKFQYTNQVMVIQQLISYYNLIDQDYSQMFDLNLLTSICNSFSKESNGGQIYLSGVFNPQYLDTSNIAISENIDNSFSIFTNVSFNNLYSQTGTIISSIGSNVYFQNQLDSNQIISNLSLVNYGIFSITEQSIFIAVGIQISQSQSDFSASLFYISNSTFTCNTCIFKNNSANYLGSIYIEINSFFSCNLCSFFNNYAYDSSILYGDQNSESSILFNNSVFQNNTSNQNLITLIGCNLQINSCQLIDNIATSQNNGINQDASNLDISNTTVSYTNYNYLEDNMFMTDYGFIYSTTQSSIIIRNSSFNYLRGAISSLVTTTGQGTLDIQSSSFKNSQSEQSTFYISDSITSNFTNCLFVNNTQIDLYAESSTIQVSHSLFDQSYSESIYLSNSSGNIQNTHFVNSNNAEALGKAIYCDCMSLQIYNCLFSNLSSLLGGALYITDSSLLSQFQISNSTFINNSAQQGGAIYVQDALNLTFFNNSFISNNADLLNVESLLTQTSEQVGLGGAIYFDCFNSILKITSNCQIKFIEGNQFINNQALNNGGAIQYVSTKYIDDHSTILIGNTAFYGPDIASYPKDINPVFITNRDYANNFTLNASLNLISPQIVKPTSFPPILSGTAFEIIFEILDQEGQIYKTDSSSKASLVAQDQKGTMLQGFQTTALNGIYNFSEIIILAQPGTNVTVFLQVTGVETYANTVSFVDNSLNYTFYLRACISGEELSANKSCSKCLPGTYLIDTQTSTSQCIVCPSSAVCEGGNQIFPNSTYWRANRNSTSFTECPNPHACIGGNDTLSSQSICNLGYESIVCGKCISDYYTTSVFTCERCPSKKQNIVVIVVLLIIVIVIAVYLIRNSIVNAHKTNPVYGVYLKIMVNHFQIILAISNIKYTWPSKINDFYDGEVSVGAITTRIFSLDCFLKDYINLHGDLSIYFQKLILYGILPVALILFSFLFWIIHAGMQREIFQSKTYFVTTIVILLFLFHPDIVQIMFTAFNCIQVDGINYLRYDVDNICYTGSHLKMILILVLPSLVIWGFGIPTTGLIILFKHRKFFRKMELKKELISIEEAAFKKFNMQYGFICTGFSHKYYFWEILVVYRKLGIIMTTVFLSTISQTIQIWAALLVVASCSFLQIVYQPYCTMVLNRMEGLSLLVQSFTLYAGLFFLSEQSDYFIDNNWVEWVFLFAILIPNMMFFSYWSFYICFELLKQIHKRSKKLFNVFVCGLINYDKFQTKYMLDQEDIGAREMCSLATIRNQNDGAEANDSQRKFLTKPTKGLTMVSKSKKRIKKRVIKKQLHDIQQDIDHETTQRDIFFDELRDDFGYSSQKKLKIGFDIEQLNQTKFIKESQEEEIKKDIEYKGIKRYKNKKQIHKQE